MAMVMMVVVVVIFTDLFCNGYLGWCGGISSLKVLQSCKCLACCIGLPICTCCWLG